MTFTMALNTFFGMSGASMENIDQYLDELNEHLQRDPEYELIVQLDIRVLHEVMVDWLVELLEDIESLVEDFNSLVDLEVVVQVLVLGEELLIVEEEVRLKEEINIGVNLTSLEE
jgi:hypothetical protein